MTISYSLIHLVILAAQKPNNLEKRVFLLKVRVGIGPRYITSQKMEEVEKRWRESFSGSCELKCVVLAARQIPRISEAGTDINIL